ncbi:transposase [Neolewinella antarctica]|uniref:Transposase IS4-like domain-containing protein n=1 Tax=Neolewinella antarctica TaxID=442734 RepID=A0ABX0XIE6_9BACT|nr:transposase [Neolewinella antarctica]NJC28533.1 hypothetical protein [Neolewinella antarctica]
MTCPTKTGALARSILQQMDGVGVWQRDFLLDLFDLWLCVHGRYNFTHLSRYGQNDESTYRNNFAKPFDFLGFNLLLCKLHLSDTLILTFDPSYISKAGKCTDGTGYYWSGVAGQCKWGLEASGIAAVDLENKVALHLDMVQTVAQHKSETLLDYYASTIVARKERLQELSNYLVADAYFSKQPFVDELVSHGFYVVTRLRKDADLRYLYHGTRKKGRGRPKRYAGKVNFSNLDQESFAPCAIDEAGKWKAYYGRVNSATLGRDIGLVVVHDYREDGSIKRHRLYFTTDLGQDGGEILHMYQCRFQQEFLYRDAKQELGLEHCQAYSWPKNDFHFNVSLTVASLAKVAYNLGKPGAPTPPFSIADAKTAHMNEYQARRILSLCRVDLHPQLIKKVWPEVVNFGLRTARAA